MDHIITYILKLMRLCYGDELFDSIKISINVIQNVCVTLFSSCFLCPQALIVEEPSSEPKESNPANLVSLKTQAASLRDQIYRIEKEEEMKGEGKSSTGGNRRHSNSTSSGGSSGGPTANHPHISYKASRKYRDKLAEIEAQIVLASPELLFQVRNSN